MSLNASAKQAGFRALARFIPLRLKLRILEILARFLGGKSYGALPGLKNGRYRLTIPDSNVPLVFANRTVRIYGWAVDLDEGTIIPLRVRSHHGIVEPQLVHRPDLVTAFTCYAPLPSRCGIDLTVPVSFGLSLLRVQALLPDGQWATILRLLAVSGTARRANAGAAVGSVTGTSTGTERPTSALRQGPSFTIIIDDVGRSDLASTLASIDGQTYAAGEIIVLGPTTSVSRYRRAESFEEAVRTSAHTFVLPLRSGDRLRADALDQLARAAVANNDPDVVYADEDDDQAGEPAPYFKPDWSPDTLEGFNYLGAPACYRTELVRLLQAANPYDLALRATELTTKVVHVEIVLCRRSVAATVALDPAADSAALEGRLLRTQRTGTVEQSFPGLACYESRVVPNGTPLVSIVIPTAAREITVGNRRIDLIVNCLRAIKGSSSYDNIEFVIIINSDIPSLTLATLKHLGCTIVRYEHPVFNVARKINLGIAQAKGEYLILMNDDIEPISPDWIESLLSQAQKKHVGVVGTKLVYPAGDLQHVGVVALRGDPDHVRQHYPGRDLGYFFSTAAPRNYLAVTGACTLVRADLCRLVGGYTEELGVSFNDVDFCLKLREHGLFVVYEPRAQLTHFESASRVVSLDEGELVTFRRRWGDQLTRDPFYNHSAFPSAPPGFELWPPDIEDSDLQSGRPVR
ncbi:glycosyltransferase [uncultured Enterovirga sp.]|uniref:glycosyltransferase family 2 protein n=1 Tax=uncultured Enterovirga sp. TaxID=2026352 RepID=UPI0035CC1121